MDKTTADSILNSLDLTEPVRLILGYRSSNSKVSLQKVPLAQDAQDMFSEIANEVVDGLLQRDPEVWEPSRPVSKETYLVSTCESVGEVPQVSKSTVQPLLTALINTDSIEETNGPSLRKTDPFFYAFQIGNGSNSVTFLRKLNPLRGLRQKRIGLLGDELSLSRSTPLIFDHYADLVFTEDTLFVLNQSTFAAIFRGQAELKKVLKSWINGIRQSVAMTDDSYQLLMTKAARDTRASRRVESIARRGHLRSVSISDLRLGMKKCGIDPQDHFNGSNELLLKEDSMFEILQFLNEDMFRGVLTDDPFIVDSKSPRR